MNKLIAYLERTKVSFGGSNLANYITLDTSHEVTDLEVVKKVELETHIKTFLAENKVDPVETIMIISPEAYFEKDILHDPSSPLQEKMKAFLINVPFEQVISTTLPFEKLTKGVATNEDLLKSMTDGLFSYGCGVQITVPLGALSFLGLDISRGFDVSMGEIIFKNVDTLKQYNLLSAPIIQHSSRPEETIPQGEKKKGSKRVFLLAGFFAILLIILVVLLRRS